MFPAETLILKIITPKYTHTPLPIPANEIPTLDHKILNDSMKFRPLVTDRFPILPEFPRTELSEVFCCSGHFVCEELDFDAA